MRPIHVVVAAVAAALICLPVAALPTRAAVEGPQASLVRDIHPTGGSGPQELTGAGGRVFFSATDGAGGRELWVTDGTPGGTRLVRDIRPGSGSSTPGDLTPVGTRLFFTASDGTHGRELWVSDGTSSGTHLVRDLTPGSRGTRFTGIANLGGTAIVALVDGQLWRSNGTRAGSRLIDDFSFVSLWDTAVRAGALYFIADASIWRTNGTNAGTRRVSPRQADLGELTRFAGRVYFRGADVAEWCCATPHLWWSDGTRKGTERLSGVSVPLDLTVLGGHLYLNALREAGHRLFRGDGTASSTGPVVPRVRPFFGLTTAAARLWMSRMVEPDPWADELWVSDGTAAGTALVYGGSRDWFLSDDPIEGVGLAGRLWFAAGPGSVQDGDWALTDHELWSSDGTPTGTVEAVDIHPTGSSRPRGLTRLGLSILFSATDGQHGRELWVVSP